MDVIRLLKFLLVFIPALSFGQNSIYPKDTIYILYEANKYTKKILNHPKMGKSLYFENIGVYYDYKEKLDTLCIKHIKGYPFSDLKEINEKRNKWIFDNRRPPADRNGVFQTYLIEIISKEKFVIYPVIWRNEGIVD